LAAALHLAIVQSQPASQAWTRVLRFGAHLLRGARRVLAYVEICALRRCGARIFATLIDDSFFRRPSRRS
jgi:hypothetical protein